MAKYKVGRTGNTTSDKLEKSRMIFKVSIVTAILLVPAVIYVIVSTLPPNPVTGKSIDKGKFDPTVTFTTDWFTFTAPKNWEEALDKHIPDKMYVYREKNGADTNGILTVYVNNYKQSYYIDYFTHALPVTIENESKLVPGELLPQCRTVMPKDALVKPTVITQERVTFKCWPDGSGLYAAAGKIDGDTDLMLRRKNGAKSNYLITYTNTAFTPNQSSFGSVLKTFEAR